MFACAEVAAVECRYALTAHVEYFDASKACLGGGEGDVRAVHAEHRLCCKCGWLECGTWCAVLVVELDGCDVSFALVRGGEEFCLLVESADDDAVVGDHVVEEYCAFKTVCAC